MQTESEEMNWANNSTENNSETYTGPTVETLAERVCHLTSIVGGSLFNIGVLTVILHCRELWNPRNFCWLFVMLINLTIVVQAIVHLSSFLYRDLFLCKLYILFYGTPYTLLTNGLALATADRYVALKWPLWYRKNVTMKLLWTVQVCMSLSTAIVLTSPYWTLTVPLTCRDHRSGVLFLSVIVYSLLISSLSIVHQIRIHTITKEYVRKNPTALRNNYVVVYRSSRVSCCHSQLEVTEERVRTCSRAKPVPNSAGSQDLLAQGDETIQGATKACTSRSVTTATSSHSPTRPELLAGITLVFGMLPILITFVPISVFFVSQAFCAYGLPACAYSPVVNRVMRQLSLLSVVYSPIIYASTCGEFKKALFRLCRKIARRNNCASH